jgi:hypothetical protein
MNDRELKRVKIMSNEQGVTGAEEEGEQTVIIGHKRA